MKEQLTLATNDFEHCRKFTQRDRPPFEMGAVVRWKELPAVIEPYDPKATRAGGFARR